jgi:predicted dehydrogenase
MKPIRVGVIGLGQRIAHVLRAMQDVGFDFRVAGYTDPAPVGLPILKERDIDPGSPYTNANTLLEDGPFDLVMIGSPNHLHFEHLLGAFEAGFPIFAEKPIVRTEEETFALARRISGGCRSFVKPFPVSIRAR